MMTDERIGGIALILGAVGAMTTMALHPTGHDLIEPGMLESKARLAALVHALALTSMPISFFGALALSKRLSSPDRAATAALVAYGYAVVAVLSAAVASGFIAPDLIREVASSSPPERDMWHVALAYNSRLNRAFALVFSVSSAAAIGLWSIAALRTRALAPALGVFGLVLSPLTIVGIATGHLRMNVHGEGMIVITEAIWFIAAGVLLLRARSATTLVHASALTRTS